MISFIGVISFSGFLNVSVKLLMSILLSGSLGGFIGLVDDLFKLNKRTLVYLTLLIALPVITFRAGSTVVYLTPWGPRDLGLFFWLIVPFVFAYLTNSVNIYAAVNGLEAGLGFVTSFSLGVCALIYGSLEAALSLFTLAGSLLGFLYWNKYPSKVFPGNIGTYFIGSVLAASIIAGVIKLAGVIATFPYFINFVLRLKHRFKPTFARKTMDGLIYSERVDALFAYPIHGKPRSEKQVFLFCLMVQVFFGFLAVSFSWYHALLVKGAPVLLGGYP